MIDFVFERLFPVISMAMTLMFAVFFYRNRDIFGQGTMNIFRQVKSWWGTSQGLKSAASRSNKKDYDSASRKIGSWIKSKTFGALDEMTDAEVHALILHEDTVKFIIKLKELGIDLTQVIGGFELPKLPGGRGVASTGEEMKPI